MDWKIKTLMELLDLSKHKSSGRKWKSAKKTKTKTKQEESLTMMHFPDANIHKWVEGYELLTLISPPIKCKTSSAVKIPRKATFLLGPEAAIA